MAKRSLFIFLPFLFCTLFCNGQGNLVANGSFEIYSTCPSSYNVIEDADGWVNPTQYSPDYFNICDNTPFNSVPQNSWGVQAAHSGNAYAGIITYCYDNFSSCDAREYIQTSLTSSLTAGNQYFIKFFVCASNLSSYSTNDIGIYISNNAISATNIWNLPYTPQIKNNYTIQKLNDTLNWTEVSGIYTALGGEKFITIGNFYTGTDSDTSHNNFGEMFGFGYHYIDDVSVSLITAIDEINKTNNFIFPNPSKNFISINNAYPIEEIEVIDMLGSSQLKINNTLNKSEYILDVSSLQNGIYSLKIKTLNQSISKRIIISN
ncbi:MAG: T9SS type A sorting domain-containing protein [Bacteroidota bacterium]